MAIIDEIKARYPRPQLQDDEWEIPDCYCVGGALCLFAGISCHFPTVSGLAYVLVKLNPVLGYCGSDPYQYAQDIINANDGEDFDAAWRVAGEALAWTPETPEQ